MRKAVLIAALIAILLMPAAWNLAVTACEHARNPLPGKFYEVENLQMYLYCSGAGPHTIVIEAGASASWLAWNHIQTVLSATDRVCTYDRNGHGWSDPAPEPRDAETIARKLHELLDKAEVPRPLILVGHSAGGLYTREYARQFPREVAGVAMIDASSPTQIDNLPGWRADWENDKSNYQHDVWMDRVRTWSGWNRLSGNCREEASQDQKYLQAQYDAETCRPKYAGLDNNELPFFEDSFHQAARLTTFGNIPLLIVTRDTTAGKRNDDAIWDREQESLKLLSPLSWRVIAKGAGHGVHHDRPDLVAAEILLIAGYLDGRAAPPFGTTIVM